MLLHLIYKKLRTLFIWQTLFGLFFGEFLSPLLDRKDSYPQNHLKVHLINYANATKMKEKGIENTFTYQK